MAAYPDTKNYECPSCKNIFVPYKENFPCPACGAPSEKYFDLIPEIVSYLPIYEMGAGTFLPPTRWFPGTLSDVVPIASMSIEMIEEEKQKNPNIDEEKYLEETLDEILFKAYGENMAIYYKGITLAAYKLYKEQLKK